jgi:hypothetical protein
MLAQRYCIALFISALLTSYASATTDQFTPVVASGLTAKAHPFEGTDGRLHIVYELTITNTNPTPATPKKLEVVDAANPSRVFASYDEKELLVHLRNTGGGAVENPTIEYNSTRLFLVDLSLDASTVIPARVLHHLDVMGAPSPSRKPTTPVLLNYMVAPMDISQKLPIIGPPLSGKGWVAANGCCGATAIHRSSNLPINGGIFFAQRFAIDWMQIDDAGRFIKGDPSDVHSYTCYGADILAVADGTVVDTLNNLDDQKPGTLPDPKTINVQNVDGNHVVIDLGDGVFAFYAHMQKDSVTVSPGALVKRGQVLGKLGNTGNTSAPHLHFHLMEGPSVLGSNGIPYEMDAFDLAGQVPADAFAAADTIEGDWRKGLFPAPKKCQKQFPLDLNIVDFTH